MKKTLPLINLTLFSRLTKFAWAVEECEDCLPTEIDNPLTSRLSGLSGLEFFQKLVSLAITLLFVGGAIIFVFIFLASGIRWITAGGDKAGVESAQKMITNALIGLAILFSVFAIISLIKLLFGIDIMEFQIPTLS